MYINFHLDILTTVVLVLDWKKQRKDVLSPVFTMSPRYLNIVGKYKLSKLDITERTMQTF